MGARLRRAWADLPRWARWVLAVYVIGFVQGFGAHIADLAHGGIRAYSANWIAKWPSLHADPARLLRPVGLLPITLFGVFVVVTALPVLRVMKEA